MGTGHGAAQLGARPADGGDGFVANCENGSGFEQVVEKLGGQCEVHRTAAADAGFFAGNGIAEYVFGGGGG